MLSQIESVLDKCQVSQMCVRIVTDLSDLCPASVVRV